jgi:putative cell wall-binding protein
MAIRTRRWAALVGTALCAVLVATTLGPWAAPAMAGSHSVDRRERVFGGLVHETVRVPLGGGALARGNILRFREDTPHLELRAVHARDRAASLETVPSMAGRELANGALGGTNGGFAIPTPPGPGGAPNGFAVADGWLVGGQAITRSGGPRARGAIGIGGDRRIVLDRLDVGVALRRPDGRTETVDEVNRNPWTSRAGELIAYNRRFGANVPAPAGSVLVEVEGLVLPPGGGASGTVRAVRTVGSGGASVEVPPDGTLLLAHGTATGRLAGLAQGQVVELRVTPVPRSTDVARWAQTVSGLPGGPLLVRNGQITSRSDWRSEAFSDGHLDDRHPRTAVAVTGDGEVLLVTIDGRRTGHSAGMTMRELATFLRGLGARDALSLDGGGSTTMTVEGQVRNRISDPQPRAVANGLFVYTDYPFDHSERLSGRDRYATAAAVARAAFPQGASHALLATGEAFPDALAGGPFASAVDGPLLLTRRDELPAATADALARLGVDEVTVLGGTAAVSRAVQHAVAGLGITVRRLSGPDRYATAVAVAEALGPAGAGARVFLASGRNFPDALTAAAPAGRFGSPVLLTDPEVLSAETRRYLQQVQPDEIVVVGGTAAVGERVAAAAASAGGADLRRLSGADRFATARAINTWADGELGAADGLVVAQGRDFPDALAGGPLAARRGQPLMIVPPEDVEASADARAYLAERRAAGLQHVTLLGGTAVLRRYQHWQLDQLAAP